jgi:alpha-ketoglutarate-dependent taurine dioxygenase
VIFPWQKGDILVLDNRLTAHGRMPFSGAKKIVLAMS